MRQRDRKLDDLAEKMLPHRVPHRESSDVDGKGCVE